MTDRVILVPSEFNARLCQHLDPFKAVHRVLVRAGKAPGHCNIGTVCGIKVTPEHLRFTDRGKDVTCDFCLLGMLEGDDHNQAELKEARGYALT